MLSCTHLYHSSFQKFALRKINPKSFSFLFVHVLVFQDGKVQPAHYPWVNLGKNTESGETGTSAEKAENHAKELFMCGQHDMFAIGGG